MQHDYPRIALRCPHCGAVLGEVNVTRTRLYVGDTTYFTRLVTLNCAGRRIGERVVTCNGRKVWEPSKVVELAVVESALV